MRDERQQACTDGKCFLSDEWAKVEQLIREDSSELEGGLQISHEIIYQHIYADKRNDGDLRYLRSQKPRHERYASGQERRGAI